MQEEKALRDPHTTGDWRVETLESLLNATTTTQIERRKKSSKRTTLHACTVFTALISYHSNTPAAAAAAAARGSVSFHGHHLHQCSNGQSLVLHNSSPRARAVGDGTAVDGRG